MNKPSKQKERAANEPQQQTDLKPKRQKKANKKKGQNESGLLHVSDERLRILLERVKCNKGVLASMDAGQLTLRLRSLHEQLLIHATELETTMSTEQSRRQAARMSGGLA